MEMTHNSKLLLNPIEIQKDKKNYIVEDCSSGEFYEMTEIGIDAIQLIQQGKRLGEIEKQLKEKYSNEEVDVIDFAEQLLELKLVASVDGIEVENKSISREYPGFLWVAPKLGKFFFNRVALSIYALLFVINIALLIFYPGLFPHYKDIFISKYMFLNIPMWLIVTSILVLIHEFGHILAIRAHNLPAKLALGHRLFLLVLETEMSSAWKLSGNKRNVLFMAGLCFDAVIQFLALLSQVIFTSHSVIVTGILRVIVLDTFIRMIYQCCIYMKTDLYYVFENISGCYNLMENAAYAIGRHLPFYNPGEYDEVVFPGETRTVRLYSIFYFIGVSLTVFLYFGFYIPQLLYSVKKIIPGLGKSPASFTFWDSSLFILQLVLGMFMLLSSWRKKYLASKAS